MDNGILPAKGSKGKICQGDSGNLSWVPSNAFDLVYTGYITPLQDPLDFQLDEDPLWERYENICHGQSSFLKNRKQQMQEMQEVSEFRSFVVSCGWPRVKAHEDVF